VAAVVAGGVLASSGSAAAENYHGNGFDWGGYQVNGHVEGGVAPAGHEWIDATPACDCPWG
jgi:hypothetical protein